MASFKSFVIMLMFKSAVVLTFQGSALDGSTSWMKLNGIGDIISEIPRYKLERVPFGQY